MQAWSNQSDAFFSLALITLKTLRLTEKYTS